MSRVISSNSGVEKLWSVTQRINSTNQRVRPIPDAAIGADGSTYTRHFVAAAVG
jgi:hypothetical protein